MAIIANFTTVRPEMAHTRTAKGWIEFLGSRAENLGLLAKLYEKHTASYFTEGFGNVIYNKSKGGSKYQKLNSLSYEWEIETNVIKRIPFAVSVSPAYGKTHGLEIPMVFTERYYEVNDVFMIDESHQLCVVIDGPVRKADDYFEYSVRLMDADYAADLDTDACMQGMTTRWIGNVQPELHETGNVKYTSNYEKLRGWIGEIRCDIEYSARYLALEDAFVEIAQEKDNGHRSSYLFKMPGRHKLLLENFTNARNNMMMWAKTTMDKNGKCTVHDRQGRELICGDGLIPQYMRYASKYNYSRMSMNVMSEAMSALAQKCDNPVGNTWAFVVNSILFNDVQKTLSSFLQNNKVENAYLWSKFEEKNIKVGATYAAYEFGGNTIVFHVDNALSTEYPNRGFGILVDQTTDKATGMSQWTMFTLRDKAFIDNTISGVQTKRGEVATSVAGGKDVVSGYSGIAAMNPYRAYVLIQN